MIHEHDSQSLTLKRIQQQPPLIEAVVSRQELARLFLALLHLTAGLLLGVSQQEVGRRAELRRLNHRSLTVGETGVVSSGMQPSQPVSKMQ